MMHRYGMRARPFSIGCQPMEGLQRAEEPESSDELYWNYLVYDRILTLKELENYELDYLDEVEDI